MKRLGYLGLAAVAAAMFWTACRERDAGKSSAAPPSGGGRTAASAPTAATAPAPATASAPTSTATASAPAARRAHAFVSGRVQGVSFRAFTRQQAMALKLTGWVKNLPDGRVEAVIEGPADKVAALLAKMRQGPPMARVEGLDAKDEPPTGEFRDFDIRM